MPEVRQIGNPFSEESDWPKSIDLKVLTARDPGMTRPSEISLKAHHS